MNRALGWGALVASVSLFGCTGSIDAGGADGEPARTVNGVAGKPLVATSRGPAVADEIVVRLHPAVDAAGAADVARAVGAELAWRSTRTGHALLRFDDARAAANGLVAVRTRREVSWAGPSYVASGTGISTSPGPVDLQWNLDALRLSPRRTWGSAAGVRIAVLDSGVAYEDWTDASGVYARAPDLAGVSFAAGYDFVNGDDHANDDQGHGTHVAGVIAASDGIRAIAPGAEVLPVKVLDASNRGTELALAEGIYFAVDGGADVINMSLSFAPSYYPSPLLQSAVDYAIDRGVILVAASGNHGASAVAYPAAFREVISVGASQLDDDFRTSRRNPWRRAFGHLEPSPYSNHGFALDVSAPGGSIDDDVDGDGNPEAILAQTFDGDPEQFDYYFYAGTSQAAAQVTGVAALMLAENGDLTGNDIRNVLGATARSPGFRTLDPDIGRGYVHGKLATRSADRRWATRDRLDTFAGIRISIRENGAGRYAEATVEIADDRGRPVRWATVYGSFSGNADGSVVGRTDRDGLVTFASDPLHGDQIIAGFQVDAVASRGAVDRPRGLIRIDSCSLELLSQFANGSGISTSPGPIVFDFADAPPSSVSTVTLMNYAWGGAVAPMAVAVDAGWYQGEFPGSELETLTVYGTGISTSPIIIDPGRSFHPRVAQVWQPDASSAACVDLVLRTFSVGLADPEFSPLIPDPLSCSGARCRAVDGLILDMWQAVFYGISTSPLWDPSLGVPPLLFAHLEELVTDYSVFGSADHAFPLGDLGGVLDAAGIGLAPSAGIAPNVGTGMEAMNN